jgi:hypothetical protein
LLHRHVCRQHRHRGNDGGGRKVSSEIALDFEFIVYRLFIGFGDRISCTRPTRTPLRRAEMETLVFAGLLRAI